MVNIRWNKKYDHFKPPEKDPVFPFHEILFIERYKHYFAFVVARKRYAQILDG